MLKFFALVQKLTTLFANERPILEAAWNALRTGGPAALVLYIEGLLLPAPAPAHAAELKACVDELKTIA